MAKFEVNQDPTKAIGLSLGITALPKTALTIVAQETFPDRQVICLSGDGGFLYADERLSLKLLKLSIIVIVFSNSSLSFVELEMKSAGFLTHVTDLAKTNFLKLAERVGILGL
jgi:pyruvate dehydrogenase (quinone)